MPVTPPTSHVFLARRAGLRIVFKPRRDQIDESGARLTGAKPGLAVEFRDGVLRVPKEGDMSVAEGATAKASDILALLENHPLNGDRGEGFWLSPEIAPEPSGEETGELLGLAQKFDVDGIKEFIKTEKAGWNREKIIAPAEEALETAVAAHKKAGDLESEKGPYDGVVVADLKKLAAERDVKVDKPTKANLIAALEAADENSKKG